MPGAPEAAPAGGRGGRRGGRSGAGDVFGGGHHLGARAEVAPALRLLAVLAGDAVHGDVQREAVVVAAALDEQDVAGAGRRASGPSGSRARQSPAGVGGTIDDLQPLLAHQRLQRRAQLAVELGQAGGQVQPVDAG